MDVIPGQATIREFPLLQASIRLAAVVGSRAHALREKKSFAKWLKRLQEKNDRSPVQSRRGSAGMLLISSFGGSAMYSQDFEDMTAAASQHWGELQISGCSLILISP